MGVTTSSGDNRRIRVWMGGVPVELPTGIVLDAVTRELPGWEAEMGTDPALRVLMFGLKPLARGILAWLDSKAGREPGAPALFGAPRPDRAAMKKNVTVYCVQYLTDVILRGLAWGDWIASYAETATGAVEITGLAPASQPAADSGAAGTLRSGAGAGAGPATNGPTGRPDESSTLRAVDDCRNDGVRQNDIREAVNTGAAEPMAKSAPVRPGQ